MLKTQKKDFKIKMFKFFYKWTLFVEILFSSGSLFANTLSGHWKLDSSKIVYKGSVLIKNFEGTSTQAKGVGKCDETHCQFLVAAPVASFDSGDSNRDAHMREVTKEALHRLVQVKVKLPLQVTGGIHKADLEVGFAGVTQTLKDVNLNFKFLEDHRIQVTGVFEVLLTNFHMKPPSLLGMTVSNKIPIEFQSLWVTSP